MLPILVPIIAILSSVALPIGLGMYIAIRSKNVNHIERMEMIRQGIIPPESTKPTPNKYRSLRNGILLTGLGIGFIISMLIVYQLDLTEDQAFFVIAPAILLFLGLSYLIFYFIVKDKKEFQDED